MSDTTSTKQASGADIISLVKESNSLLDETLQELSKTETKVAAFEADSKNAEQLIKEAVEKMAELRINGTPLIDEGDKQAFLDSMQSKHGMADVLVSVLGSYAKHAADGATGNKVASSLGVASDRPQSQAQQVSGFASLASHRLQM